MFMSCLLKCSVIVFQIVQFLSVKLFSYFVVKMFNVYCSKNVQ
nr:MAG TPA: hypothetical protein [Caudoviricetes sp.]